MPLTLEQHFKSLADQYPEVLELHSLWMLFRKDLEDRLPHSRTVFVHYSLHDVTHSRSVIRAIERFLGEERISTLSATDTFMLLICAYAHDYGMAMTFNQIYDALGSESFQDFLAKMKKNINKLGPEDAQAVKHLIAFAEEAKVTAKLQDMYFSILLVIQLYFRPTHWKGVEQIWDDFSGLLEGRLNSRFIQGGQGIIDICAAHGMPFDESILKKMNIRADGIIGDEFHPRFIAAMLRLGDLLDLDNGRFPRWFVTEINRNRGIIPQLSTLHYKKHEAITHLLITPKRIEVCASCDSGKNGYEVANLVSEWIGWLKKECTDQILNWSEIISSDFGRPPRVTRSDIKLDGKPFTANSRELQMRMPQERVMKLLEGTNIYKNQYVGIRELVQNAVDASLLQLWDDITYNHYINIGIDKHGHKVKSNSGETQESDLKQSEETEMKMLEHEQKKLDGIFNNYEITVELIQDMKEKQVYVVVKDKGIGITPEDVRFMSDIGSSKEMNKRIVKIMKNMPRWLKPSGVFGIGLQSVFQLTDHIEFYTRRPNEPERLIVFHSYGRNYGKIEIREVKPDSDGIFYNNSVPGTNVKIAVDPQKLLINSGKEMKDVGDHMLYYDMEFDDGGTLNALFVELSLVIKQELQTYPCDYFNVYFQPLKILENGKPLKGKRERMRYSYFSPHKDPNSVDKFQKMLDEDSIVPLLSKKQPKKQFSFTPTMACYVDDKASWIHKIKVRPGSISMHNNEKRFKLPHPVRDLYHFQYKFNPISDSSAIYPASIRRLRKEHAGFLNWDINIMDDQPEKYLNIDRDRLRDGAVIEKELVNVRAMILTNWCRFLIERQAQLEQQQSNKENQARAKYKQEGNPDKFREAPPANLYKNYPQELISLALLFYQDVPEGLFRQFINPYTEFLEEQNLILADEGFRVDELWKAETVFRYCIEDPYSWAEEINVYEDNTATAQHELHKDTICRLPHRLIHIFNISLDDSNHLWYYFRLGQPSAQPCAIHMDEAARLKDYIDAIDKTFFDKSNIDTSALIRIVFKPNMAYPHLLIPKYPKNFKRGDNFSSPLDHCIRWYILSPIDRELAKWLKFSCIKDKRNTDAIISDIPKMIEDYVKGNVQFEKCVKYVLRQMAYDGVLPENLEQFVRNEYKQFLLDCCTMLIQKRELILRSNTSEANNT